MKKKYIAIGLLFSAVAIGHLSAKDFILKGYIKDIPDGYRVILLPDEGRSKLFRPDTVYTSNGGFEFKGNIAAPALAKIAVTGGDRDKVINFMLEDGTTEIEAPGYDSIPSGWYVGTDEKMLEKGIRIRGGEAQREMQEYNDFLFPYDLAMRQAHFDAYWDQSLKEESQEREALYQQSIADYIKAERRFVAEHPAYNISMRVMTDELAIPYAVDDTRLDEMAEGIKQSRWSARRDTLLSRIERYRPQASGKPYVDVSFTTESGDTVQLADYVAKGKWVLIDFWASWCGPCRLAIPKVKEIHDAHEQILTVLSVSVDKERDAWLKAMAKEAMPWNQFRVTGELDKAVSKAYKFQSIPTFVLIDPEGGIALETHDIKAVVARFDKI